MRLAFAFLFFCVSAFGSDWYVATNGNNSTGDGSIGNPYLTLQKAVDASSVADKPGQKNIWVRGGVYTNSTAFIDYFSVTNVLISGYQSETATILGGQRLTGWTAAGSNGWYACALPAFPTLDTSTAIATTWHPRTLIVDGRVVPVARFPGTGKFFYTSFSGTALVYTNTLEASTNGEVQTDCGWTDTELGITAINTGTKTITTTAAMARNGGNCDSVTSWAMLNTPDGMIPSECFWWNKTNNTIVYKGPSDPANATVYVPTCERIIWARGIDAQPLTNCALSNLTFACTTCPLNDGSKDDVGTFYFPAVDIYAATNCKVVNCTLYGMAGKAIGQDSYHSNYNFVVANCYIHDIGGSGIGCEGGTGLIATNNYLQNIAQRCQCSVGIAGYKQTLAQGNVMSNLVGAGIWIPSPGGKGQSGVQIISNKVLFAAQQLRDYAAYYTIGTTNLLLLQNVAAYIPATSNTFWNWTEALGGATATNWNNRNGFYLDFGTEKARMISNITYDCDMAFIHHAGSNNYISNNFFINTRQAEMQINIHNSTNTPPLVTNNLVLVHSGWPRINIEDQNYIPYGINTNIGVSGVSNWVGNCIYATNGNNGLNPTNATTADPQLISAVYPKQLTPQNATVLGLGIKPLTFFDDILPVQVTINGAILKGFTQQ